MLYIYIYYDVKQYYQWYMKAYHQTEVNLCKLKKNIGQIRQII